MGLQMITINSWVFYFLLSVVFVLCVGWLRTSMKLQNFEIDNGFLRAMSNNEVELSKLCSDTLQKKIADIKRLESELKNIESVNLIQGKKLVDYEKEHHRLITAVSSLVTHTSCLTVTNINLKINGEQLETVIDEMTDTICELQCELDKFTDKSVLDETPADSEGIQNCSIKNCNNAVYNGVQNGF